MLEVAQAQLSKAGLGELVDEVFSTGTVRAFKPAPEPYRLVAERCGVEIRNVWLVAAHAWDVSRALAAGCRAAFVPRPGGGANPADRRSQLVTCPRSRQNGR